MESVEALAFLTPEDLDPANEECCLWHEVELKCIRDPRYSQDPDAQDYFGPADDEIPEEEMEPVEGQLRLPLYPKP